MEREKIIDILCKECLPIADVRELEVAADRILALIATENAARDEAVRELQEALYSWFGWLSLHEDKTGSIATVRYRQADFDEVVGRGQSALAKLKETSK